MAGGGGGEFLDVPAVEVEYGDPGKRKTLRVTALRVKQIPRFARAYQPMLDAVLAAKSEDGAPCTTITVLDLIELQRDDCITVAAIATDLNEQFFRDNFSLADFAELMQAIFNVNQDYFRGPKDQQATAAPGATAMPWNWEDSIQHLIAAGHRETDVLDYTIAKLFAYGAAVDRQQRRNRAAALVDARAAQYDKDDFMAHFKSLTHG